MLITVLTREIERLTSQYEENRDVLVSEIGRAGVDNGILVGQTINLVNLLQDEMEIRVYKRMLKKLAKASNSED